MKTILHVSISLISVLAILCLFWQNSTKDNRNVLLVNNYKDSTNTKRFGYFLQITDAHLDDHYRDGATVKSGCHTLPKRHVHSKHDTLCGTMGMPGERMDVPSILIEHTLDWIRREWRDKLDFVIWTGDNSRHDWDEKHRRKERKVLELNKKVTDMIIDLFCSNENPIPVVPVIGNNDVQPHNLIGLHDDVLPFFEKIWDHWIPKTEKKSFLKGGYFAVDVVPNIRVLSMNTMFFLKKNHLAKDCTKKKKKNPGYQHLKWYKQQLNKARTDGMKVYVVGHVPPSPNDFLDGCLNDYVSITSDYSDIVLGHFYGHLNMDHFLIYDTRQEIEKRNRKPSRGNQSMTIQRDAKEYVSWLKDMYRGIVDFENKYSSRQRRKEQQQQRQLLHQKPIYNSQKEILINNNSVVVVHVAPSVFPIYMPAIRIYRYEYQQPNNNTAYGKLLDFSQYVANISKYNEENGHKDPLPPLSYDLEYNTSELYGLPDLSINSYVQFSDILTQDSRRESKNLWNIYSNNIFMKTLNSTLDY
ncbi:MAG: Metallo-dependent phosphatase-like protein [Benjaminiella poitrasii]|nr:MAG: Metallo-dependent phosphatase-like protein [Benjaminiella poitrasii]